ncbi:hypothetical protein SETIT_1G015700v2 [Setaria italica]|uniref:Uncharacterized protein n=1 Tax=Setaria italica TaxID=4555 RepID=A0A368PG48_SETIT|nr:hypothetical protein SETIT_1G015700v2 [Setaria italica]
MGSRKLVLRHRLTTADAAFAAATGHEHDATHESPFARAEMPWAQTEAGPVVEPVGLLGRQEDGSKRPRSSLVAGGGRSSPPFVLLLRIYRRRFLQSPNPTPGDGVLLPSPFTTPHAASASASASSLTKARRGFHGLAVCGFQWRRRFRGTTDRCLPTASSSAPRPLSAVHDV